jgi:hypothetical protein
MVVVEAVALHKEGEVVDVDVDKVHPLATTTTLCAKYARKKVTPLPLVGGDMRRATTTTMVVVKEKLMPPMVLIQIGMVIAEPPTTSPATLRS